MKKQKPIHLITQSGYRTRATCDYYTRVVPLEATIMEDIYYKVNKGTFNPKKVTCKRCQKNDLYKEALDKVNNPLFYWREGV